MSQLRTFADRYYHVKQQMENLEELRFAEVTRKHNEISLEVDAVKLERQRAEAQRNSSHTGADWLMWQRYVQLLETVEQTHVQDLLAAGVERDRQQKSLWTAHVESTRWETLKSRLAQNHRARVQRMEDRRADEMAALRANKGGT